MKPSIALFPALLLAFVFVASQDSSFAQEIAGVKCIVDGDRNALEQFKADYAGGEVYFCCPNCAAAFAKDNTAYQTQANHQLVLTKQFVQKVCPINGTAFDAKQTAKVGGVEVAFCCAACKGQVDAAADLPAKAELVFGKVAFDRAFASVDADAKEAIDFTKLKCPLMPHLSAKENIAVDHRGAKVYFCCAECAKSFKADPTKHAEKANFQLVASGQFVQKSCPLTAGDVDATKTADVAGQAVGCCCGTCQSKLESATDDEKMAMVFGDEAFEKSFAKVEVESAGDAAAKDYSVAPEELPGPK